MTGRHESILRRQENGLALDNSGNTRDSVASGASHLVYAGWLRPHSAGPGDHRDIDPRDPRAQTNLKFRVGCLANCAEEDDLNSIHCYM